eukprot:GILJ01004925.1.p1 GENE.GILJ01004925.1~~GILJ01004925.1.p1  ORF type:complete len:308 (+),score=31.37 GILJ01004925.1:51-926(+)
MASEWKTVVRRAGGGRRSGPNTYIKNANTRSNGPFAYQLSAAKSVRSIEDRVLTLKTDLNRRMEELQDSKFSRKMAAILSRAFETESILGSPIDVVCYGLGSYENSTNAQYQLACALLLHKEVCQSGSLMVFDPMLTEADIQVSQDLGCTIIESNEEGKRCVHRPTLFFMPHCSKGLYHNTLYANWSTDSLHNVYIVGNSFSSYSDRGWQLRASYDIRHGVKHHFEVTCIEKVLELVSEESIENCFTPETVFNDLSLHHFPSAKVKAMPMEFWSNRPELLPGVDMELIPSS